LEEKSELLFGELVSRIRSCSRIAADMVCGKDESKSDEAASYRTLRKYLNTDEAMRAFERVVVDICQSLTHSILVMLDGGSALAEHFLIALIDRETKEELLPAGTYHELFTCYLIEHADEITKT